MNEKENNKKNEGNNNSTKDINDYIVRYVEEFIRRNPKYKSVRYRDTLIQLAISDLILHMHLAQLAKNIKTKQTSKTTSTCLSKL